MLRSLWPDLIGPKVECGECLRETKRMRSDEKVEILHCFVGEHWQDVALLDDRSD